MSYGDRNIFFDSSDTTDGAPVRRRRSDCDFDDEGSQNRRMEFVTPQAGRGRPKGERKR